MNHAQLNDLKNLDAELAKDNLRGLWARPEAVRREPEPFGKPMLWKWAKIRAGLEAAGELITTNYKGARRAISLVHPKMSDSTSHTLNLAVQLVKAGEAVYSHRHTNAAMRFVIDGGAKVYTITNGEKCVMERGDLVIQPSWGWHNHINETDRDAIWIDGLDSGLMRMLRTMFQEPHPAEDVRLFNSPVDTTARNPGLLAPPGQALNSLVYKWVDTRRALTEMLAESESLFDGKCLEYRNPVTGGAIFPTFSCWIQQLVAGTQTVEHRHTSSQLYYAVEGSGVTEVEGEKLEWEAGDFFVVPNWSWHRHRNSSAQIPAVLFSTTDRPLHEAIGVYREQNR
ncbi:MAG TPA: cupin domain-containing protein [Candidatus Binatus sp.]|nr:cupin domain-containing protein [Candidatus Binatus sp.]